MNLVSIGNQIINLDKITRVKALSNPENNDPNFCIQIFFENSRITLKGKSAFVIWRKLYWMVNSDLSLLLGSERIKEDESKEQFQKMNE